MRVLFVFIVLGLLSWNAYAEDAAKPIAKSAAPGANVTPDSAPTLSTTQAVSSDSSLPSSVNPDTSSISTSLKGIKPQRRFKGEYLNWVTAPTSEFKNSDGGASSYNWIGLKYMLSETKSVSVRQPFTIDYSYAKKDAKGVEIKPSETNAHVSDLFVNLGDSKFVEFLGDGKISAAVRVYLPTGEKSRLTKGMGGINLRGIVSKPLSKSVTVSYNLFPTWLNQTQDGYTDAAGVFKPNVGYTVFQYAAVDWNFSKYVGFSQAIGTDNTWYRRVGNSAIDIGQDHYTYIDSSLTISYPLIKLGFFAAEWRAIF